MLESTQYELLNKLRHGGTGEERKTALRELIFQEQEGAFEDQDFIDLLRDEDPVFQSYAIGAMGRNKIAQGVQELIELFETSRDPLILSALLSAFADFAIPDFKPAVLNTLKGVTPETPDSEPDDPFLVDQLLVPALKYLQAAGDPSGIEESVLPYLKHEDPTVRWHALRVFNLLEIRLPEQDLETIIKHDKSSLVREQAAVLLERRSRGT